LAMLSNKSDSGKMQIQILLIVMNVMFINFWLYD
jgi:hypothetical protein